MIEPEGDAVQQGVDDQLLVPDVLGAPLSVGEAVEAGHGDIVHAILVLTPHNPVVNEVPEHHNIMFFFIFLFSLIFLMLTIDLIC